MARRQFFRSLAAIPLLALSSTAAGEPKKKLHIMMKSAWGSDDPTRASFPFNHALALADASHDADVAQWGFKFGNPAIFVSLVEWADRIITE